jgi:hypothetical protein
LKAQKLGIWRTTNSAVSASRRIESSKPQIVRPRQATSFSMSLEIVPRSLSSGVPRLRATAASIATITGASAFMFIVIGTSSRPMPSKRIS